MGGHDTFVALVREFYRGVANDPPLRSMYPEGDLGPAANRLLMFLEQYWGGPRTYSETRGHPRLRARHGLFVITPQMRDSWLRHMLHAVDTLQLAEPEDRLLREYFLGAADFLVNTPPLAPDHPTPTTG